MKIWYFSQILVGVRLDFEKHAYHSSVKLFSALSDMVLVLCLTGMFVYISVGVSVVVCIFHLLVLPQACNLCTMLALGCVHNIVTWCLCYV